MHKWIVFVLGAVACLLPLCCAQDASPNALNLLTRVAAHYRDAEYLHVEFDTRETWHSTHNDSVQTANYSLTRAPGQRFRYTGVTYSGSGSLVSDGTDEWRVMNSLRQWAKEPSGKFFLSRSLYASDNTAILGARDQFRTLTTLDARTHAAHFAPDQVLDDHGKKVVCAVVTFGSADGNAIPGEDSGWNTTVWIDRSLLRVLRFEQQSHGHYSFGNITAQYGPRFDRVTVMNVTLSDFNFHPLPDSFAFVPPADATEVAKLPSGYIGPPPTAVDADAKKASAYIGKPLPEITLKDASGADVSFSRYKGRPLLIDVWATWCGPCISEMDAMEHIRKSTSGTDLQIVAVDEDLHSSDAREFLKRRGDDWPDFAYTQAFSHALSLSGIPLTVLVNADGKIVYYHSGADDAKGLAEAIVKLGSAYAGVRTQ